MMRRFQMLCLVVAVLGTASWARAQGASGDDSAARQAADAEAKYLSNITQLTSADMGLVNAGEAYFSPDAKTIIFQATPEGKDKYQIYTLDLKKKKLKMVSTGHGGCTCAFFHPKEPKIIFASSHLGADADKPVPQDKGGKYTWFFDEEMDVFEAGLDGSNLKRLTETPGYDAECAYSPDGKRIVFTSMRDGDAELYIMDADGSNQRRLTFGKGYDGGPFFSPDGKKIIYRGDRRNDGKMNLQIRMVNADGYRDTPITDNPIFNWAPYWYPNGECFIFTQVDHEAHAGGGRPNYDLVMMSLGGAATVRITHDPAFDGLPVFSPDGKKVMWTSKRGGLTEPQIFIADFKLPDEFKPSPAG